MHPGILLDRDGVIVENRSAYIRAWKDVSIFPQALAALARIRETPYKVAIVTNQAGIGKGLIPESVATQINKKLVREIEMAGGRVDGVFVCPHTPAMGCACRKPEAGLLLQAAEVLSLDLHRSLLVGDSLSDLQAARAAGVHKAVLVRTGRGDDQSQLPEAADLSPFSIYDSLADALVELI